MSATTYAPQTTTGSKLGFGGIVRSEWIKFRSVRSSVWSLSIFLGLSLLMAFLISALPEILDVTPSVEQSEATFIQSSTIGATVGAIVMAVLGVLVISGEYSSGMIRSTFAAVPRRLPVLAAKAVVLFTVTFIIGLASSFGSALLVYPNLVGRGLEPAFTSNVVIALVLSALYVSLVAVFALGVGAIVRNSAGGVSAALGVLLVLPTMLLMIGGLTQIEWITEMTQYLLNAAGESMFSPAAEGMARVQDVVTTVLWAAVPLAIGAVLITRRDA